MSLSKTRLKTEATSGKRDKHTAVCQGQTRTECTVLQATGR